jgi:hypothetical protein
LEWKDNPITVSGMSLPGFPFFEISIYDTSRFAIAVLQLKNFYTDHSNLKFRDPAWCNANEKAPIEKVVIELMKTYWKD